MTNFEQELSSLLNRYSQENESDTPDFILASYLLLCLGAFNATVNARRKWWGDKDQTGFPALNDPQFTPNIAEDESE